MREYLTAAKRFIVGAIWRKEEGASMAEYGLLLVLIAAVCLIAIAALGTQISSMFSSFASSV
jgi:pilus assembly protein Flp/PilA